MAEQVWKSWGGAEFASREEAIAHDNLCAAVKRYEEATQALTRALAGVAVTADGAVLPLHGAVYRIVWRGTALPGVERFQRGFGSHTTLDVNSRGVVIGWRDGDSYREVVAGELYTDPRGACSEAHRLMLRTLEQERVGFIDECRRLCGGEYPLPGGGTSEPVHVEV